MAKATIAAPVAPPVTLVLESEEAKWLRSYLQNKLTVSENAFEAKNREAIFNALHGALSCPRENSSD